MVDSTKYEWLGRLAKIREELVCETEFGHTIPKIVDIRADQIRLYYEIPNDCFKECKVTLKPKLVARIKYRDCDAVFSCDQIYSSGSHVTVTATIKFKDITDEN